MRECDRIAELITKAQEFDPISPDGGRRCPDLHAACSPWHWHATARSILEPLAAQPRRGRARLQARGERRDVVYALQRSAGRRAPSGEKGDA